MKCKVVYEDDNKVKVIRGDFISEDEYTVTVKPDSSENSITIGKRSLVQLVRGL